MKDDSQAHLQPVTFTTSPQLNWYLIDTEFASTLHPSYDVHTTETAEIFAILDLLASTWGL